MPECASSQICNQNLLAACRQFSTYDQLLSNCSKIKRTLQGIYDLVLKFRWPSLISWSCDHQALSNWSAFTTICSIPKSYDCVLWCFCLKTSIYFQFSAKTPPNEQWAHFMIAMLALRSPYSFNNHSKDGRKIRLVTRVTHSTTITTLWASSVTGIN